MAPKVVTIASQKGGVGKTTLTANLGHALALSGKQVLLIDFDAQGGLAAYLNVAENSGSYHLLTQRNPNAPNVRQFIHSFVQPSERENLWVLPGDKSTSDAQELVRRASLAHIRNMLCVFDGLGLDFILIDTSPSIGGIQESANYASDLLLIPTHPKHLSMRGMKLLWDDLQRMRQGVTGSDGQSLAWKGKLLGIVLNEYEERKVASEKAVNALTENFPGHILPPVHRAQVFIYCEEEGVTIFEKEPNSRAAEEVRALAVLIQRAR
jgi:chromosome partitioning protein